MKTFQSGQLVQQYKYKSFLPNSINREFEITDKKINILLEKASKLLGELNAFSRSIPDLDFYTFMVVSREATISSRIEGTKTVIDELVLPEEDILPEKKDDWKEVKNYINAVNFALGIMKSEKSLPFCTRLIKATHKELLTSVRGEKRLPGEIRTSQNWIGGQTLADAFFIPPTSEEVPELLSDLEKFWHNEELELPILVKIAIFHYQFETIHPFLDGNGRVGRLIIILQLIDSGILKKPSFYMSVYFDKNKEKYYQYLTEVRNNDNIEQWIKFFLEGIAETAESTIETFEKIDILKHKCNEKILLLGRRAKIGTELLRLLFSLVSVNVDDVSRELGISWSSANTLVSEFVRIGIVVETTKNKKFRRFVFSEYLDIFRD